MAKIRVVMCPVDRAPYVTWIEDSLENLQKVVGGYIECVTFAEDAVIICNEEGRILGLPDNCRFYGVDFVGTVLIVGTKDDEFCDVPEAEFLVHNLKGEKA